MELPETLAAYFAAKNRHDIDAMAAVFTDQAVVRDEGATYTGRDAIKAWMTETTRRYAVTVSPLKTTRTGEQTAVEARVAGNFPGSPATLTYRFKLADDGISGLEIG
jgi:uncharacterized protein (TIGR02246 family)